MIITWQAAHDRSPVSHGFDLEHRLVGQVAFYDVVAGGGPGWVGYVHGQRVTGRCVTAELAQRLVAERA